MLSYAGLLPNPSSISPPPPKKLFGSARIPWPNTIMTNRKSHMPFRLVSKSTTLDHLERPITLSIPEKMRLWEPATKIWMKIDPCNSDKNVGQWLYFLAYKAYADILRGSLGMGRQTTVGLSTTAIFSVFAGYFFGNFRDKASTIIQRYVVLVRFSVIPKCMTLDNLEWLFRVKFCFHASLSGFRACDFENNCVKTNEDRHILLEAHFVGRDSIVSGSIGRRFLGDNRAGSLEKNIAAINRY